MSNFRKEEDSRELYRRVLTASIALFIKKGFENTTVIDIANLSGVPKSKIMYEMRSKEDILCMLVTKFLGGVTEASDTAAKKLTDDRVLIFIANEVLQLYMAELNEDMRNLYLSGYSMQKTSEEVLKRRTNIMYEAFSDMFRGFALKDFYETEIASMGIMRAYMSVPCNESFTIEQKAKRLVIMLLRIYEADEKILNDALAFIEKIDFDSLARKTVESFFSELEIKVKELS